MRTLIGPAAVVPLLLLLAGCSLVSVTLLIDLDVAGSYTSNHNNVAGIEVNLTDDPDFAEHQDQIKSVDEVGFVLRMWSNMPVPATGELWISREPVLPATDVGVRNSPSARRVLSGLTLPEAGEVSVSFDESLALQENQAFLHQIIQTGHFYLYGIAGASLFQVTVDDLTVVVVMTVEE